MAAAIMREEHGLPVEQAYLTIPPDGLIVLLRGLGHEPDVLEEVLSRVLASEMGRGIDVVIS